MGHVKTDVESCLTMEQCERPQSRSHKIEEPQIQRCHVAQLWFMTSIEQNF